MILSEGQREELRLLLADLDENYICFGYIMAEPDEIIKVVEKFLEDNNAKF